MIGVKVTVNIIRIIDFISIIFFFIEVFLRKIPSLKRFDFENVGISDVEFNIILHEVFIQKVFIIARSDLCES